MIKQLIINYDEMIILVGFPGRNRLFRAKFKQQ